MRNLDELPMADPGREKDARQLFDFTMSPDEYAAREGHGWYCFSFDDYRYSDQAVETWIQRLGGRSSAPGTSPRTSARRLRSGRPARRRILKTAFRNPRLQLGNCTHFG